MSDASFRGDCGRCAALCCFALALDRGPHFAIDKPAGVACPHQSEDHRCAIHSRLTASGFAGCARYDCLGAGQLATAMFAGLDLKQPAIARGRLDAFARLTRFQGLRLALSRLGRDIPPPQSYAELLLVDFAALVRLARSGAGNTDETSTPPTR